VERITVKKDKEKDSCHQINGQPKVKKKEERRDRVGQGLKENTFEKMWAIRIQSSNFTRPKTVLLKKKNPMKGVENRSGVMNVGEGGEKIVLGRYKGVEG